MGAGIQDSIQDSGESPFRVIGVRGPKISDRTEAQSGMSAYLDGQGAKGSEKARKREKCERTTTAFSGQQTLSHGRETPPTISHKDRPPKSLTPLRPPPRGYHRALPM